MLSDAWPFQLANLECSSMLFCVVSAVDKSFEAQKEAPAECNVQGANKTVRKHPQIYGSMIRRLTVVDSEVSVRTARTK